MSRAVFLPTPGDPFVCLLSLKLFERFDQEVDTIYVYLNGDMEPQIVEYLKSKYEQHPKVNFIYNEGMTQHGNALAHLTHTAMEDYVMFLEDDAYVLKPGTVDEHFKLIESGQYDMIGSPRCSSSMDLQRVGSKKFNIDISGHGDVGIAFWPNFFFCRRADLLKTDMDFNAHCWQRGEYIPQLDWIVQPDEGDDLRADTFVWGSIQMRGLGLKAKEVPQYHVHPYWEGERRQQLNIFSHHCNWMHSGSLSGSIYGVLCGDDGHPLAFRKLNREPLPEGWKLPGHVNTDAERKEYERRVSFYLISYRMFSDQMLLDLKGNDFVEQYGRAIERMIQQYSLDRGSIENQIEVFKNLL